jgi:CRISPR system Cascade subunit CasD
MPEFLLIRLEGPLQSWGDVTRDAIRPTRAFPARSAIAGMLASALGWTYRDGAHTTALQDALWYAVRVDRIGALIVDYQTAELATVTRGWTHWGIERRDIANVTREERVRGRPMRHSATQQLWKSYLADASFLAAIGLRPGAPVGLDTLAEALRRPARPLFLGRRACPPSVPLLEGRVTAARPYEALVAGARGAAVPCWYDEGEGPACPEAAVDVWDRRDFVADRFEGGRRVVRGMIRGAEDIA